MCSARQERALILRITSAGAPRTFHCAGSARLRNSPTSPASSSPTPLPTSRAPPSMSTAALRRGCRSDDRSWIVDGSPDDPQPLLAGLGYLGQGPLGLFEGLGPEIRVCQRAPEIVALDLVTSGAAD